MKKTTISYTEDQDTFEGYYAYEGDAKKPVILICHDWGGRSEFTEERAEAFAKAGYLGFAIDVYGKGVHPQTTEEKTAAMSPLIDDRSLLLRRLLSAVEQAKKLPTADANKIVVIGYCFGGLCALDLARNGVDLKAVIALHANLTPPPSAKGPITAKVLAFHGYNDPLVPPATIVKFGDEMTKANAEWDMTIYGKAQHGFARPQSKDHVNGIVYHAEAERKSWRAILEFLADEFK